MLAVTELLDGVLVMGIGSGHTAARSARGGFWSGNGRRAGGGALLLGVLVVGVLVVDVLLCCAARGCPLGTRMTGVQCITQVAGTGGSLSAGAAIMR